MSFVDENLMFVEVHLFSINAPIVLLSALVTNVGSHFPSKASTTKLFMAVIVSVL
jgi:hypothetical protein